MSNDTLIALDPISQMIEDRYNATRVRLAEKWQLMDEVDPDYKYALGCNCCKSVNKFTYVGFEKSHKFWVYKDIPCESDEMRNIYKCDNCGSTRIYGQP